VTGADNHIVDGTSICHRRRSSSSGSGSIRNGSGSGSKRRRARGRVGHRCAEATGATYNRDGQRKVRRSAAGGAATRLHHLDAPQGSRLTTAIIGRACRRRTRAQGSPGRLAVLRGGAAQMGHAAEVVAGGPLRTLLLLLAEAGNRERGSACGGVRAEKESDVRLGRSYSGG
jgi:hypothetical protein